MKRSTKSALLSAFVFPGVGHIFLKQYCRDTAMIILTICGIGIIVNNIVQSAFSIFEKVQTGEVMLDGSAISDLLAKTSNGSESILLNIATFLVIACWIIGIIDSYRIGNIQDKLQMNLS